MIHRFTRNRSVIFVVLGFVIIGTIALLLTHAAVSNISAEAETGVLAGGAYNVSASGVTSGGTYVKFKAATPPHTITLNANEDGLAEDGLGPWLCTTPAQPPDHPPCSDSSNLKLNNIHQLRANVARTDCDPNGLPGNGMGHTQCHGHHNRISYFKFDLASLDFVPHSVTLQLWVLPNGDCNTSEPPPLPYRKVTQHHSVHAVLNPDGSFNNSWSETTLTWNNRPVLDPTILGHTDVDKILISTYFQIPFSNLSYIKPGIMSFAIENNWTCHQTFAPHDNHEAHPPQLVINP